MSETRVTFDRVWKKFRSGERHDTLRDLCTATLKGIVHTRPVEDLQQDEFWALKDVSFEVKRGTALGIIGPNGAGKSTSLKVLTRIMKPTKGRVEVRGKAGALIEVAAGFHPDLTGRENVYLQGAIMGMKRAEIMRKLPDIIEFAGMEPFIDTPVKRYSSGMNARLGFSVAANLEPDVLFIDEVLSVGDMAFQQRCIARMHEFKRRGVAIVFVSHNLQAVVDLCDEAVFLMGDVRGHGSPLTVIGNYIRSQSSASASSDDVPVPVHMAASVLLDRDGRVVDDVVESCVELRFCVTCTAADDLDQLTVAFRVHRSTDNLVVYDGTFKLEELGCSRLSRGVPIRFDFRFLTNLTRGQYHIEFHILHDPTQQIVGRMWPASMFAVGELRTWGGIANLQVSAECYPVDEPRPTSGLSYATLRP